MLGNGLERNGFESSSAPIDLADSPLGRPTCKDDRPMRRTPHLGWDCFLCCIIPHRQNQRKEGPTCAGHAARERWPAGLMFPQHQCSTTRRPACRRNKCSRMIPQPARSPARRSQVTHLVLVWIFISRGNLTFCGVGESWERWGRGGERGGMGGKWQMWWEVLHGGAPPPGCIHVSWSE